MELVPTYWSVLDEDFLWLLDEDPTELQHTQKIIQVLQGKDLSNTVSQHDVTYFQKVLRKFGLLGKAWDIERIISWGQRIVSCCYKNDPVFMMY